MSEREGPRKIKVVDRRRFDESGDLRPDRPQPARSESVPEAPIADPVPPPADPPSDPTPPTAEPTTPEPTPEPRDEAASGAPGSPLFLELVAGLAQQAEILISGGQGIPAQPAEAQRVIDYLAMLEVKTEGNLSAEEKQILSNVVFQLRTLFVQQGA